MASAWIRQTLNRFLRGTVFIIFCTILLASNASAQLFSLESPETKPAAATDTMSLYFQNIDVRTLLQLVSKKSGYNFVISDTVQGNITLSLKDVTWRQALNTILYSKGLASNQIGNVIYITTTEEMASNLTKKLQSEQALDSIQPLRSTIIQLRYSDAKVMSEMLKGQQGATLISPRGQVTFDLRTNTIIIVDTEKNIAAVQRTISNLDIPSRQVVIEARIVSLNTSFEEQLGARLGFSRGRHFSGTLSGANQLAQGIVPANISPIDNRLNFDIPASSLTDGSSPASIALALAKLGQVMLDLELSALESEGHIQIISKPRVVTSNQQKAVIQTGQEIPYQEASSSGATSVSFKKAVLSLEVTPIITPTNKIILKLRATQDSIGPQLLVSPGVQTTGTTGTTTSSSTIAPEVYGPPTINTQEVESSIILNNNETFVVGGIFKLSKNETVRRVPFLGSLPVIGFLFRNTGIKNEKSELLIFITPKIIEPSVYGHAPVKGETA